MNVPNKTQTICVLFVKNFIEHSHSLTSSLLMTVGWQVVAVVNPPFCIYLSVHLSLPTIHHLFCLVIVGKLCQHVDTFVSVFPDSVCPSHLLFGACQVSQTSNLFCCRCFSIYLCLSALVTIDAFEISDTTFTIFHLSEKLNLFNVSALMCDCVLCHFLSPLFPVAAGFLIVICFIFLMQR